MERTKLDEYKHRIDTLVKNRGVFNNTWDDVSRVVRPDSASFTGSYNQSGKKNGSPLYDAVGVHSNQLLAAGFYSLLTNPQTKWFELTTVNPNIRHDRDVTVWLNDVTDIMLTEIQRPQTGFTTAMHEFYLDYGAYGNGTLFITQKDDRTTLQFLALPLQECYYVEGPDAQVSQLYRKYQREVHQLVSFFGLAALSVEVQRAFEAGRYDEKVNIVHVIEPNACAYQSRLPKHKPWSSIYFDYDHGHIMQESGFDEKPFAAARFYKTSYEVYGRGPGCTALADLQSLQEVMKTTLKGAQKAVDPPLLVPDEAFIKPVNIMPGGVSYYRPDSPADKIVPLMTQSRPEWGMNIANDMRERIRSMFFVDQLQLSQGPQMTATEVLQRTEEKMRMMGPQVGRAMTECVSPTLERSFYMLLRAGVLPPPPAQIMETWPGLHIAYLSPFAKAQDQTEANSLLRMTQLLGPFMSVDPTVMDVLDSDSIARRLAAMYAIDPRCLRSEEEVAEIRQQRAEQAQQAQMMDAMKNGGEGFSAATQGIKNIGEAGMFGGG